MPIFYFIFLPKTFRFGGAGGGRSSLFRDFFSRFLNFEEDVQVKFDEHGYMVAGPPTPTWSPSNDVRSSARASSSGGGGAPTGQRKESGHLQRGRSNTGAGPEKKSQ